MSSLGFEECAHKILKMGVKPGQELEVCLMLIETCTQEKSYLPFYGLVGQRFCLLDRAYQECFDECFRKQYASIHHYETNKLRNLAKFYAHLLHSDALPWTILDAIELTEEKTTSSSRIFIKFLFQTMAEFLGMRKLRARLQDPTMAEHFKTIFPMDNPKSTRFSINFFSSIGLGGLTDQLRKHLESAPQQIMANLQAAEEENEEESESSAVSSSSALSPSGSLGCFSVSMTTLTPVPSTLVYPGPPEERQDETPIYNTPFVPNPPIASWDPEIHTPYDLIERVTAKFSMNPCLGQRNRLPDGQLGPYVWQTYADVRQVRQQIGSALIQLGCRPRDRIGIFSKTCAYFTIMDLVCQAYGFISVPLYYTLGPANIPYVINHSNCRVIFSSQENFRIIQEAAPQCPNLLAVVHFGELDPAAIPETGTRNPLPRQPADDDDHLLETYDPTDPRTFGAPEETVQLDLTGAFQPAPGPFRVYSIASFRKWVRQTTATATNPRGVSPPSLFLRPFLLPFCSPPGPHFTHFLAPPVPPRPTDVVSIMYTSGTTGIPKGVILQHSNLTAALAAGMVAGFWNFEQSEIYYAYLPLAHIFERIAELVIFNFGGRIGYFSGDTKELIADLNFLKPSLFVGVPRVLNKMCEGFKEGIAKMGWVPRFLFNKAYAAKLAAQQKIWDRLVFRHIKAKMGGNLKFILCGSAPLAPAVQEFLQVVLGTPIQCGYSMTETTLSGAIPRYPDFSALGNCGQVMASLALKLRDCPEMRYSVRDQPAPRGEILVRGPAVFHGYYRDPALSRAAFTPDGWLHTGDVGAWLPCGSLQVIDRIKNIFKLAQGEYVAPEHLETVYKQAPAIAQCFVHGDSTKRFVVALVNPSRGPVMEWIAASAPHLANVAWEDLMHAPEVIAFIKAQLAQQAKAAKLNHYEIPEAVALLAAPIPEEFVTPTMKFKRIPIRDHYQPILDALYTGVVVSAPQLEAPHTD
ncbi:putative Long chain acyl-CoA synthetase 7 [Paratrimastix pyriformis]|uniref:Long chain acyl-CoA synthetase 7 n=1 Tax=Paratrimastix pyriformis TaxID=342808 RepID=A0ABQ8UP42_9EUKA|nr:putative Long chain acyl-CoA synthetase 7 [Paratrimastix pyriformis]